MHGSKDSPQVPVYGNKGIFVRGGTLSMHGTPREFTWAQLGETIYGNNTNTITLDPSMPNHLDCDWQEGDKILITSSDIWFTIYASIAFSKTEIFTIESVVKTSVVTITLDHQPIYTHYAADD